MNTIEQIMAEIRETLKNAIKEGFIAKLSRESAVSRATIYRIIEDDYFPNTRELIKLASALGYRLTLVEEKAISTEK